MSKRNFELALRARGIKKSFNDGTGTAVHVLNNVSFEAKPGEVLSVVGTSGSGKSTLLQILGGLDTADAGEVSIAGSPLAGLSAAALGQLRNRHLGFVYQFHHLLPEFTALENVAMPLWIRRENRTASLEKARAALELLGLGERTEHLPSQLSGGERQRAAVARAMVSDPTCILADEPTGNLDSDTAMDVFSRLLLAARTSKTAVVIVTHDPRIAAKCDRTLKLEVGAVTEVQ